MKGVGESSATDECPKCGAMSYRGGYCFECGAYRSSKHADSTESEVLDCLDFMKRSFGTRVAALDYTEEQVNEALHEYQLYRKHSRTKPIPKWRPAVTITKEQASEVALLVQGVVQAYGSTPEGDLVRALVVPWRAIVERLKKNWIEAFQILSRMWEEMIAAAFEQDGFEEVILTPRSRDRGRDVVAIKKGVGCIRIIDSVKAYAPEHLVGHDDVRALAGGAPRRPSGFEGDRHDDI